MKFFIKSTFGRHKGIHKIKEPKVYQAEVHFSDTGETVKTTAKKENGHWMVGGDKAAAWNGGKIFIISNNKYYYLKGNRLVFQDNLGEDHPHYAPPEAVKMKTLSLSKMVITNVIDLDDELIVETTRGTYYVRDRIASKNVKGHLKKWILDANSLARIIEFNNNKKKNRG